MEQKHTSSKWLWSLWIAMCLLWAGNASYDWSRHQWVSPLTLMILVILIATLILWLRGARARDLTALGQRERAFFTLGVILATAIILGTQILLQSAGAWLSPQV